MNKYTELSDFEINLAVAHIVLGKDSYGWCPDKKEVYLAGIDGGNFLPHGYFDPCNNVEKAWKIMMDNEISVTPTGDGKYFAFRAISFGGGAMDYYKDEVATHEKPPVAAMLCFLELNK